MKVIPIGQGRVLIVIPCYNHGAMLREALVSVEEVRNANVLEVIIVDDGSSEAEKPSGFSMKSRRRATASCLSRTVVPVQLGTRVYDWPKANFILPLDSDNRLRGLYLDEGVSLLKNNPSVGVVYADAEFFGERSGRWYVPDFNLLSLIRMNFIDACALYRKRLWENVSGYDERMLLMGLEDWDFWLRVSLYGGRFIHLPKIGFDSRCPLFSSS